MGDEEQNTNRDREGAGNEEQTADKDSETETEIDTQKSDEKNSEWQGKISKNQLFFLRSHISRNRWTHSVSRNRRVRKFFYLSAARFRLVRYLYQPLKTFTQKTYEYINVNDCLTDG
jgi:hypothetical protein